MIDGSTDISRRLGISSLVIGLTVVAFGTSAPDLSVDMMAAYQGHSALVLGNVNGSNIANVLLMLGLVATMATIEVKRKLITRELPFMILGTAIVYLFLLDGQIFHRAVQVTWVEGLILLALFALFTYSLLRESKLVNPQAEKESPRTTFLTASMMILAGTAGLLIGGQMLVDSSVALALRLGVSQAFIGLTVIGVGTSLPELVASVIAARRKQVDLAIGNVIGSNTFNSFAALGASALVGHGAIIGTRNDLIDAAIAFVVGLLLLAMLLIKNYRHRKWFLSRGEGLIMLFTYAGYIAYIAIRG